MQARPSQTLRHYLKIYNVTAEEFATISGMPVSEINGILRGQLRITRLRACHLAAVFGTDITFWTDLENSSTKKKPAVSTTSLV